MGGHRGLMWFYVNRYHISGLGDLDLSPFDLEITLPFTPDLGNHCCQFERELTLGTEQTVRV